MKKCDPITRMEPYRSELLRHATRMLGSRFEADDAVQETMARAWKALDRFEGRSQIRSWLYRICTNVCLDMLASRQRRARPGIAASEREIASGERGSTATGAVSDSDPAEMMVTRESVRIALETILRHLPPRQRAVLLLREVLRWRADEVADLLGTSVASVNSALQRARATLRCARGSGELTRPMDVDDQTRSRLDRYARALEMSDVDALTALITQEAA